MTPESGGPDEFLTLLRSLPGEWNRAKADAFERLVAAFPDPAGPPEWGLRQILRGQFDRRLPAEWKPAFVEVYHQWLGFRAESAHSQASPSGTRRWWTRSVIPGLRPHGVAGGLTSPLAALAAIVLAAWIALAAGELHRRRATSPDRQPAGAARATCRALMTNEKEIQRLFAERAPDRLTGLVPAIAQRRRLMDLESRELQEAHRRIDEAEREAGVLVASPAELLSPR